MCLDVDVNKQRDFSHEISLSLAVHPAKDRFALGTSGFLRAFDANGARLWDRPTPDLTWAVNICADGRLVVAAFSDGTIRWYRMADGVELLAFMPLADSTNWIAWTPEGVYMATAGAHGILRWYSNRGWDTLPESAAVESISGARRPEVLPLVLQELETPRAVGLAYLAELKKQVAIRTNSQVPPGAVLHLLAIGIGSYNETYANHLRLNYADRDARDLASAIANTQSSLYATVKLQLLVNRDASKDGILCAMKLVRADMRIGRNDLAVVHFSGHGALVDEALFAAV